MSVREVFENNSFAVLSGGYDSAETSVDVNDVSRLPTRVPFRAVYYNHKGHPDVDSDAFREIVRVTAISVNTLTIERGIEGPARDHNAAGAIHRLRVVPTAVTVGDTYRVVNVKNRNHAAIGDGTGDDGPAFQAAINEARETGGEVFVPAGHYRVASQVTDYTGVVTLTDGQPGRQPDSLKIRAQGGAVIQDAYTAGPSFLFSSLEAIEFRGIAFEAAAHKQTHPILHFSLVRPGSADGENRSVLDSCQFRSAGFRVAALVRQTDSHAFSYRDCMFRLGDAFAGWEYVSSAGDGGLTAFRDVQFTDIKGAAASIRAGTKKPWMFAFSGCYFQGSGSAGISRLNLTSLGTFTATATTLAIGSGHTLAQGDALWIGNNDHSEVVIVSSYSGSDVVIYEGLVNDYSSDASVELIAGPLALATSGGAAMRVSSIGLDNCGVFECGLALNRVHVSGIRDSFLQDSNAENLSGGTKGIVFPLSASAGLGFERNRFSNNTGPEDTTFVTPIDTAGPGSVTDIHAALNVQFNAGGVIDNPVDESLTSAVVRFLATTAGGSY